MPEEGISDAELLTRLRALYREGEVMEVAKELAQARSDAAAGLAAAGRAEEIRQRYLYRMHNLSEFMKSLLIRFTRWFNRVHRRTGTLWEERFKSVIVESGIAARTMAAYIDLNPVRAGMVREPAEYRWSSYGEAVGGGRWGNGKKARAGLVRACLSHEGVASEEVVARIHRRYIHRMHDLSEFMKTLLQRFTRWFNRVHERSGTLWEERFKSVIVESGIAARTMAAYIDLNPVRAGMVADPAEYRWSSYGEAIGGGSRGNGKKAREGLVRACLSHEKTGFEAGMWSEVGEVYRKVMGMALERKGGRAKGEEESGGLKSALHLGDMLRHRVRYFTDGAVIGSKAFVNEAFGAARERFTAQRKDGARRLRGSGKAASGVLWSARDLRVGI